MPSISNLPAVTAFTGTMIFPLVDVDESPDRTKRASFGQLRNYILEDVSVYSVAGRTGNVTLNWADVSGLATISTTGNYANLIGVPSTFAVTTATAVTLGGVKIGANINVTTDGTISVTPYTLLVATTSTIGGVKAGSGISVGGDGTISTVPMTTATVSALGGVKVGSGLLVTDDGVLSVNTITGTTSEFSITNTSTTALQVTGGANIQGDLYANNVFASSNEVITTASIASYANIFTAGTSTAIATTGVNVAIWSTEDLQSVTDKSAETTNAISITNSTASTGTTTGSLVVAGGVGVGGDVHAGNIYSNGVQLTAGSYLTTKDEGTTLTNATSIINFTGAGVSATNVGDVVTVTITSGGGSSSTFTGGTVTGATQFTNTTESTTTDTGAVTIAGGLGVGGNINVADTVVTQSIQVTGASTPRVTSGSNLELQAVGRVQVIQSPFQVWSATESELLATSASNGDIVYNVDQHKFQGYANGVWVNLH